MVHPCQARPGPVQGTDAEWIEDGAGVRRWRGPTEVKAPVLAPARASTASQRALPANAAEPKSSGTVNRPPPTGTSSSVNSTSVVGSCA